MNLTGRTKIGGRRVGTVISPQYRIQGIKSSGVSGIHSTGSKASLNVTRSKSKSSKRPASADPTLTSLVKSKKGTAKKSRSKSSVRSGKSKSKHHPSKTLLKPGGASAVRSASTTSDNKSRVKSSKGRSKTRPADGSSSVRSTTALKSRKKKSEARKSGTKKKTASRSRSLAIGPKSGTKTDGIREKSKAKSITRSAKSSGKRARTVIKYRTETCAVQFVPKFNPTSNKNQLPIDHLIRRTFGNMVREAICQLDKDKSGVSSQQIIDHILKHYAFPNHISESVIRNRAMFTINSGLRADTLLNVGSSKGIRIGRMLC